MANNAKCISFLLLTLCFSLQSHARDSKFFSKLAKQNHDSISLSPTMAPTLAPSPSPEAEEIIEHGYGLYGQDPFQSYEYAPTTTNPTKVSGEKFVSADDLSNVNNFRENGNGNGNGNRKGNGIDEKQGMSDTRFLENGKYYHDTNQDNVKDESSSDYFHKGKGNGYEMERQGMSDTRFLENGKYFHDINEEKKNGHFNTNNFENENDKFEGVEEENNGHFNTNSYENENEEEFEEDEKHGLSDTRFMENGKYYSNMNEGKKGGFEIRDNGNGNGNQNENFEMEKHGLSDTRFLENGKYYYDVDNEKGNNHYDNHNHNNNNKFGVEDVNDERVNNYYDNHNNNNNNNKFGVEDVGFHNNNNVEFANTYNNGDGYENEYETEATGGYNYHPNEYHVNEGNGAKPKKYVYDTMEEYDREQGYIDGPEHYRP